MHVHTYLCISVDSVCIHTSLYFLALSSKKTSQDPVVMNTLVPRSCSLILFPAKKQSELFRERDTQSWGRIRQRYACDKLFYQKESTEKCDGECHALQTYAVMNYKPLKRTDIHKLIPMIND